MLPREEVKKKEVKKNKTIEHNIKVRLISIYAAKV